jgi:hypothetical protein
MLISPTLLLVKERCDFRTRQIFSSRMTVKRITVFFIPVQQFLAKYVTSPTAKLDAHYISLYHYCTVVRCVVQTKGPEVRVTFNYPLHLTIYSFCFTLYQSPAGHVKGPGNFRVSDRHQLCFMHHYKLDKIRMCQCFCSLHFLHRYLCCISRDKIIKDPNINFCLLLRSVFKNFKNVSQHVNNY